MNTPSTGYTDIAQCIHPKETSRFWLAIFIVLPVTVLFIMITVGMGLLIVPIILFFSWFAVRTLKAHLLGSCAEITPNNFSEVHDLIETIRSELKYPKTVEAYVYQNGDINTLLIKMFRTRIIMLPHELLVDTMQERNRMQLKYLLSRAVGHLKAKHMRIWWLSVLIDSFEKLAILNIFLYPWERATQYSGDRIGLATCSDLGASVIAMNKLMLGSKLAEETTLVGALEQRQKLQGSFFGWFAQAFSTHPHLTNRIASLISWSKSYDIRLYEAFMGDHPDRRRIESLLGFSPPATPKPMGTPATVQEVSC